MSFQTSNLKGHYGELQIIQELNKLPRDYYFVLNDLLIEHEGYTTQIDHLIISVFGIFIIETKNWSGKIYGDQYSSNWKQYINNKEFRVMNPVQQNWVHKKRILEVLRKYYVMEIPIFPIIVFTEKVEAVKVSSDVPVIKLNDLAGEIFKYQTEYLNIKQVNELYCFFNELNILDETIRKIHNGDTYGRDINFRPIITVNTGNQTFFMRRVMATLIDFIPFIYIIELLNTTLTKINTVDTMAFYLLTIFILFQFILLFKGKTLGKQLTGLKVVKKGSYTKVGVIRMFIREYLLKPFFIQIIVGIFVFIITQKSIHGEATDTIVVKNRF